MPLPHNFKRYTFAICFGISIFPFVALNLAMYLWALQCCDGHSIAEAGFPIKWYVTGWVFRGVMWEAFFANALVALIVSLISAKILKSVFQPIG
jgi:hypothetical protein